MEQFESKDDDRSTQKQFHGDRLVPLLLHTIKGMQIFSTTINGRLGDRFDAALHPDFCNTIDAFIQKFSLNDEQIEAMIVEIQKQRNTYVFLKTFARMRVVFHEFLENIFPEYAAVAWEIECTCEDINAAFRVLDQLLQER
jgi:hypothetical protein